MEILKVISSIITPIIVLIFGVIISKTLERNKLSVLKEKEWQVKWSELFLAQAIEFNSSISKIICGLHQLMFEKDTKKIVIKELEIKQYMSIVLEIEWNIKNFTQFAPRFGVEVENAQKQMLDKIKELINKKQGDLEVIRRIQFQYNQAVKNAHAEMLNS